MNYKDILFSAFILVIGLGVGYILFHTDNAAYGSPSGTTFSTSKVLSEQVVTGTTTAVSFLNSSGSSEILKNAELTLYNGNSTTTSYTVACATSTSPSSLQSNTNYILDMTILSTANSLYGTTTGNGLFISSTSPGLTGQLVGGVVSTSTTIVGDRVVPNGAYLDCQVTTGDSYNAFNSGVQGTISFPYTAQ